MPKLHQIVINIYTFCIIFISDNFFMTRVVNFRTYPKCVCVCVCVCVHPISGKIVW